MITRAKFTDFKLLRDVEIALGRFNVIVGANGTGKSTVLEGLDLLLRLANRVDKDQRIEACTAEVFRERNVPGALTAKGTPGFSVSVSGPGWQQFEVTFGQDAFDLRFRARPEGSGLFNMRACYSPREFWAQTEGLGIGSAIRLRLDATRLAQDHYSDERNTRIEDDGTGLASVLQETLSTRDGRFENIERDLAKVVPAVKRIRITRASIERREKIRITVGDQETWSEQLREYIGSRIEIEWGKVGWIPAAHLSEGTLLALGVITVLHHNPPRMILLDDIDKALHPTAQRELVAFLKSVIQSRPEVQILATTHSPYVVDELAPEDILVCASTDERESKIRRLSDHPGWNRQKDYLRPGEFWSATGEAWVVDGKS